MTIFNEMLLLLNLIFWIKQVRQAEDLCHLNDTLKNVKKLHLDEIKQARHESASELGLLKTKLDEALACNQDLVARCSSSSIVHVQLQTSFAQAQLLDTSVQISGIEQDDFKIQVSLYTPSIICI